jgi:hypothetical protein
MYICNVQEIIWPQTISSELFQAYFVYHQVITEAILTRNSETFWWDMSPHSASEEGFTQCNDVSNRKSCSQNQRSLGEQRQWFDSNTVERHQKTEAVAAGGRFPHGDYPRVHNMSAVKQLGVWFKISKLTFTSRPTQYQLFSRSLKPGNKSPHR